MHIQKYTPALRELVGRVRQSSGGFVVLFGPFEPFLIISVAKCGRIGAKKHQSGYNGKREET